MRPARNRRGRPAASRWLSATGVRDREVVRCEYACITVSQQDRGLPDTLWKYGARAGKAPRIGPFVLPTSAHCPYVLPTSAQLPVTSARPGSVVGTVARSHSCRGSIQAGLGSAATLRDAIEFYDQRFNFEYDGPAEIGSGGV